MLCNDQLPGGITQHILTSLWNNRVAVPPMGCDSVCWLLLVTPGL